MRVMSAHFERDGIAFQYPENWAFEEAEHDGGWAVTVQSRDTAFLTLSYHADQDDLAVLADSVLTAFREEYQSVESDPPSRRSPACRPSATTSASSAWI